MPKSLTVRPYTVTFLMFAPDDPEMTPAELPIELEAFDVSDALQQAGILAEAQMALLSNTIGTGVQVKAARVVPNPPPAEDETLLMLEAVALVAEVGGADFDIEKTHQLSEAFRVFVRRAMRAGAAAS